MAIFVRKRKSVNKLCLKMMLTKILFFSNRSLSSFVSCQVRRMTVFQASRASDFIRDVCSESDDFTVGILNKLKPSYLLLCGQLIKAQFSGITRFFRKTLTRILSRKHEYVPSYHKGQYIIHAYNASLCRVKIM